MVEEQRAKVHGDRLQSRAKVVEEGIFCQHGEILKVMRQESIVCEQPEQDRGAYALLRVIVRVRIQRVKTMLEIICWREPSDLPHESTRGYRERPLEAQALCGKILQGIEDRKNAGAHMQGLTPLYTSAHSHRLMLALKPV